MRIVSSTRYCNSKSKPRSPVKRHCVLFPYSCFLHCCALSGRGPGGHLVSLRAARSSSDPKLRAAGPPAPHATVRINISRGRAEQGRGRPERPGPRGGDSSGTKVREASAPPGLLRGAHPAACSASAAFGPLAAPQYQGLQLSPPPSGVSSKACSRT